MQIKQSVFSSFCPYFPGAKLAHIPFRNKNLCGQLGGQMKGSDPKTLGHNFRFVYFCGGYYGTIIMARPVRITKDRILEAALDIVRGGRSRRRRGLLCHIAYPYRSEPSPSATPLCPPLYPGRRMGRIGTGVPEFLQPYPGIPPGGLPRTHQGRHPHLHPLPLPVPRVGAGHPAWYLTLIRHQSPSAAEGKTEGR